MSYEIIDEKKTYVKMSYVQKYYNELFTNLLEEAYDNSLISHNELFVDYVNSRRDISSYYVMTLSIIADCEEDIYYDMTDVYYSSKVEYAIGEDLDDIGLIIGCPRPEATRAGVELLFSVSVPATETIPLNKGIVVSTKEGISYSTVEDGVIPIGETEVSIYALSLNQGWEFRVDAEELYIIENGIEEVAGLRVTNPESSTGGRDEFDDEEYRELLMNWVPNITRGGKEAYERYFAYVDGIESYKLIPNWDVSGTLKIVIDPGYPYQLKQCYDEICESVCQLPDDITMFSPERVGIDIYATCNVDIDMLNPYSYNEKEEIKSKIIDAIKLYINGDVLNQKGLGIGEDFIPYQLGVFVNEYVPELKNIIFYEDSEFSIIAKPITITEEQKGYCNDINIEME